jgi:hypothetical protein
MLATNADAERPRPVGRGFHLRVTKLSVCAFALLLVAPWLVILGGAMVRKAPARVDAPTAVAGQSDVRSPLVTSGPTSQVLTPGPWGELEITPIVLEPPTESLLRLTVLDSSQWYFPNSTPAKVDEILKQLEFSDHDRLALLQTARSDAEIDGVSLRPEPSLITALRKDIRAALYEVLWRCPKNLQAEPFRRPWDPSERWFEDSGLGGENAALAQRLVYRRGNMEAFADVSAMLTVLTHDEDRIKLFRALSQQSSYVINLRIRPDTDLAPLVAYWGANGREREVEPMLRAVKKVPGGGMINAADLLPAFPRGRVHTYPPPAGEALNGPLDCHWTSLNFWNDAPDNQFLVSDNVTERLLTGYTKIEKPAQLGDIIVMIDDRQKGIHSAVHIADDLFLTKNGSNVAVPWLFMKRSEMTAYYETLRVTQTICFRKNGL